MIKINDYEFLKYILWDKNIEYISPEELFYYIDKRYKYINKECLSVSEKNLIKTLQDCYGNGIILSE